MYHFKQKKKKSIVHEKWPQQWHYLKGTLKVESNTSVKHNSHLKTVLFILKNHIIIC